MTWFAVYRTTDGELLRARRRRRGVTALEQYGIVDVGRAAEILPSERADG